MDITLRESFNQGWSPEKYEKIYSDIEHLINHRVPFRMAETPVFLPNDIWKKAKQATEELIAEIIVDDFLEKSEKVFELTNKKVPNCNAHPHFIQFDFGMTVAPDGSISPKLIELQGFPSLYFYQPILAQCYNSIMPESLQNKYSFREKSMSDLSDYYDDLKSIILNGHDPKHVILMEVDHYNQPTFVDFGFTEKVLGIKLLCISEVKRDGRHLYYLNDEKEAISIKRIYNRVIFDELEKRTEYIKEFDMTQEVDVEWAGHPDWYFRLSKFSMPYLKCACVPKTYFLDQVDYNNLDLSQFVLKPLFSFAGGGVEIDVTSSMLDQVDRKNCYILQEKVEYASLVEDLEGEQSKFELRVMATWAENETKPKIVGNLVRLSKGKMVGVKYNKDKTWVGGSVAFIV